MTVVGLVASGSERFIAERKRGGGEVFAAVEMTITEKWQVGRVREILRYAQDDNYREVVSSERARRNSLRKGRAMAQRSLLESE
jgi:hypothetical protein